MHEASVIQRLLEEVARRTPRGSTVRAARIEVGALEHLDREALGWLWRAMAPAWGLEGAALEIAPQALEVRCRACGLEHRPPEVAVLVCPRCADARPEVLRGAGVWLRAIEVESAPAARPAAPLAQGRRPSAPGGTRGRGSGDRLD